MMLSVVLTGSFAIKNQVSASAGSVTYYQKISYGGTSCGKFQVNGIDAFCIDHYAATPSAGTAITNIGLSNNETLKKVLYYGYGGPACRVAINEEGWVVTSIAASCANGINAGTASLRSFYNEILTLPNAPSNFNVYIAYTQGSSIQDLAYWEYTPKGYAKILKSSSNPGITTDNKCYSLEGATYGVFTDSNCTNRVGTLTTDANGSTGSIELDPGTYYVKEISAPEGYSLDSKVYSASVASDQTTVVSVSDDPMNDPMSITLEKIDDSTQNGTAQGNASLAGAEFTICYYDGYYTKEDLPEEPTKEWVFETKAIKLESGKEIYGLQYLDSYKVSGDDLYKFSGIPTIPLGTITIEETKAPEGYTLKNKTLGTADGENMAEDGIFLTQIKNINDTGKLVAGNEYTKVENVIRGGMKIQKWDYDSGKTVPQAGLTFKDTVLEITNISKNSVIVEEKEYQPGEVVKTLTLDENGYAETDADLLPYGEYEIKEVKSPVGYLNEGVISQTFSITDDGEIVDLTSNDNGIRNILIRGDFEITKIDSDTQKAMPGVQFKITNVASGESHIITTDENGFYSSENAYNKHSEDTNGEKATSGLWFGDEPVLNNRGAIPYGVYTIEEIQGEENVGMVMYKSTFTISRNGYTIDLENIENHPIEIKTTAKNKDTNDHYAEAAEEITIVDTVSYKGVTPGKELTGKGVLMDKETGEPILDSEGNPITSEIKFTPETENGSFDIEFTFNGSELKGKTLVVFEELYDGETLIGEHKDITDEGQTIYFKEPAKETPAAEKPSDNNYQTGINQFGPFFLLLAFAMIEIAGLLLIKKRK